MIVWVNGPFGAGKTTTTRLLLDRLPGWRSFDPEWVGYMLRAGLSDVDPGDFQRLPPWRALVPAALAAVASYTGADVVAPQTVLVEDYWHELRAGFAERGLDVLHVVLDLSPAVLEARIRGDADEPGAQRWRLDHVAPYLAARGWLHAAADVVVATGTLTPPAVADLLVERITARAV